MQTILFPSYLNRFSKMTLMRSIVLLLTCFGMSSIGHAKTTAPPEVIEEFTSHIVINNDAALDITETITVLSQQNKIRHGIVRWLPTYYMDSYGIKHHADYQIIQVQVNHHDAPYQTAVADDQLTIDIGNRNNILDPGVYTYTLHYQIHDVISFLPTQDELLWNITGNSWDYPILKVQTTLELPKDTSISKYTAYTGKIGMQRKDFVVNQTGNQISFTTTQTLLPRENFAVEISWPKGSVTPPGQATTTSRIHFNFDLIVILELIVIILLIYYLVRMLKQRFN